MKKIILAIALILTMGFGASAQYTDGFFNNDSYNRLDENNDPTFSLPTTLFDDYNQNAPLGSGLFILTALGAGYAFRKKSRE